MKFYHYAVIVLIILAGSIYLIGRNRQVGVKMAPANTEYEAQGYEEASINLDADLISKVRTALQAKNITMSDSDYQKISQNISNDAQKKDDKAKSELSIIMNFFGAQTDTKVVTEWDNTLGNVLRIYAKDKDLIENIRQAFDQFLTE